MTTCEVEDHTGYMTRQRRWTVNYTRQANRPERITVLALTAELAAEHARTHIACTPAITVTGVELEAPRPRKAKAAKPAPSAPMFEVVGELDGFEAWMADQGDTPTKNIDGFETIADFAFAIEVVVGPSAGRLFA